MGTECPAAATHPSSHILLCPCWVLRILMWTIEGQCKHCGNVCGSTRKILLLTKRCFFYSRHRLRRPDLCFGCLSGQYHWLRGGIQIILQPKMSPGWQREEDATLIMPLLGCQPTNDIIDITTSGCPSYTLWRPKLAVNSTYVYARLTLNFVLCTFTEQCGIKMKCNLNSQSAYTSCQVLSLWLLLTMNRDLKHQQQLEA